MRGIARGELLGLAMLLAIVGPGLALAQQQNGTFVVAGHTGQAPVTHLNGGSYVAIDALARLTNGSLSYQGNQITLTLPHGAREAANQYRNSKIFEGFSERGD